MSNATFHEYASWIGGAFTVWATVLSVHLIYKHSRNYTRPHLQRSIIRILWMVPIYAVDSWLSLMFKDFAMYFDLIRDCYEAYVLYQFFTLLVNFLEEGNIPLDEMLSSKPPLPHPWPMCCLQPIPLGRSFYNWSRLCVLQFAIVKPLITLLAIVLAISDAYGEGDFSPTYGYVYVVVIDNISITISMYFLILFYQATKEELAPFKPVLKLICIKAIIFFSFWQGVVIAIIAWLGWFQQRGDWSPSDISEGIQDFMICIEMFLVSLTHYYVFGYEEYRLLGKTPFVQAVMSGDFMNAVTPIGKSFVDTVNPVHDYHSTMKTILDTKQELEPLINRTTEEIRPALQRMHLMEQKELVDLP